MVKERILVFTKNWLGDVIFEEPFIRALKRKFPFSEIVCVSAYRCIDILNNNPNIDKVIGFDEKKDKGFFAKIALIMRLRKLKITKAFLLHRSKSRAWIVKMAGIPFRCGYNTKKRKALLTHSVEDIFPAMHRVDYFLKILKEAELYISLDEEESYFFYYSDIDKEYAFSIMRDLGLDENKFIVINPGGNWQKKRWPIKNYIELIRCVLDKYNIKILISGSISDKLLADEILNGIEKQKENISVCCGKTTISQSGALFAQARCVISADSGPLHIASGVGTDVVALFGPTNPQTTGPRGRAKAYVIYNVPDECESPCYDESCQKAICMEDIKPSSVLNLMEENRIFTDEFKR